MKKLLLLPLFFIFQIHSTATVESIVRSARFMIGFLQVLEHNQSNREIQTFGFKEVEDGVAMGKLVLQNEIGIDHNGDNWGKFAGHLQEVYKANKAIVLTDIQKAIQVSSE